MSIVVTTALHASETWKSTTRIQHRLDVFHQQNLWKILGITWREKIKNEEVLQKTGERRDLQDIVAERRFRFAGHIIRLPQERPAHCAMDWTPWGRRKKGRPKKTWRTTFKEDLQLRGISRCEVEAAAAERTRGRLRYLATHCPAKARRNY